MFGVEVEGLAPTETASGAPFTVTVAVPGAEAQPDATAVSTTEIATVPALPAVKVILTVPCPAVIVPFPTVHT